MRNLSRMLVLALVLATAIMYDIQIPGNTVMACDVQVCPIWGLNQKRLKKCKQMVAKSKQLALAYAKENQKRYPGIAVTGSMPSSITFLDEEYLDQFMGAYILGYYVPSTGEIVICHWIESVLWHELGHAWFGEFSSHENPKTKDLCEDFAWYCDKHFKEDK